jgi:uncharacterized membrane protein
MEPFEAAGYSSIFALMAGGTWGLVLYLFNPVIGLVVGFVLFLLVFVGLFLMATSDMPVEDDEQEMEAQ